MVTIEIKGVDKVVRGLKRHHKVTKVKAGRGLLKAAMFIMRESLKIVPVQIGNLKGSWDVRKESIVHYVCGYFGGSHPNWYAAWVHEIPHNVHAHGADFNVKHAGDIERAKGTWRGTAEGGMFRRKDEEQWKFLERPIREHKDDILKIIRDEIIKSF